MFVFGRKHHSEGTGLYLNQIQIGRGTIINDKSRGSEQPEGFIGFTLRDQCCISSSWLVVRTKLSNVRAIHTLEIILKSVVYENHSNQTLISLIQALAISKGISICISR